MTQTLPARAALALVLLAGLPAAAQAQSFSLDRDHSGPPGGRGTALPPPDLAAPPRMNAQGRLQETPAATTPPAAPAQPPQAPQPARR